MLMVFEKFLEDMAPFGIGNHREIYNVRKYFPTLTCDENLIRWHIAVLLSEFTIPEAIVETATGDGRKIRFTHKTNFDCLNWSGQKMYKELKAEI